MASLFTPDDYWDIDGVLLQTHAKNIETVGGKRIAPSPFRGENITIPHRRGKRWIPKVEDSRVLGLNMWVRGCTDAGLIPTGRQAKSVYDDNLRALMNLIWRPGEQFILRKHFSVNDVIKTAVALAEFGGGLEPSMIGRSAAKMTVDLDLADPMFYDEAYTSVTLADGANTIFVPGDAKTTQILINISGSRNVTKIRNATAACEVLYNDSLNAGDAVQLDIDGYNARYTPNGGIQRKMNSKVVHSGAPEWLSLKPGNNTINLSSISGVGQVILQYKAAWQ